jgi:membrane-bound metal-dependent hydrolase YbcI (DUF457 family)
MMGGNHAACGAAAWIAATTRCEFPWASLAAHVQVLPDGFAGSLPDSVALGFGLLETTPAGVLAGALVCAGAALLPDADHRSATIAQALPPVSNALCAGLGRSMGGHRKGTHSLFGLVAAVVLAAMVGLVTVETARFGTVYPGAGIATVLLAAFAAKALRFIPDTMRRFPWAVGLAAGAFVALNAPEDPRWFAIAVGLGAAVHVAGDLITTGGVALTWPLRVRRPRPLGRVPLLRQIWRPNGNIAVPLIGNAGSVREWVLSVPIAGYALAGLCVAGAQAVRGGGATLRAVLGV